jgi:hypothetical protein
MTPSRSTPTALSALAAALAALALSACTDASKAPAEAALKAAETAVATVGEEVERLAPDQVAAARQALASAKSMAEGKDFKGALAAAGEVPARVKAAVEAAQAKKEEAAREAARVAAEARKAYDDAVSGLPRKVDALKARLAAKGKKLPKGLTKAQAKKARAALQELEDGLARVEAKAKEDAAAAAAEAAALQKKAADLMKQLKVKLK